MSKKKSNNETVIFIKEALHIPDFSKWTIFFSIIVLIINIIFSMYLNKVIEKGLINIIDNINYVNEKFSLLEPNVYLSLYPIKKYIIILCILMLVEFMIAIIYFSTYKNYRRGEEYGSAKIKKPQLVNQKISDIEYSKNRILTENVRMSITGKSLPISLNTLVLGGMGSGKSWFTLIPNLLQGNTSFIITDPSKELLKMTGGFLEKVMGYKLKILDLEDFFKSFRYNFFKYIDSELDIKRIVDVVWKATADEKNGGSSDPMWNNMAKDYFQSLIALLYYTGTKEEQNIETVIDFMNADFLQEDKGNRIPSPVQVYFEEYEKQVGKNLATDSYRSATDGAVITIRGVKSSLRGRLGQFLMPDVQELMSVDELELENIGKEKTALFLVVPSEDTTYNFIVSMVYAQLFPILYKTAKEQIDNKLPVPVQIMCDEMANFVMPKDFISYLTTGRKHQISFMMFFQEMQQIEKMFEKEYKTLMGTCQTILYLGGSGYDTNKYFSNMIGNETISQDNYTRNYGKMAGSSKATQLIKREVFTPDEIDEKLFDNKALLYVRGQGFTVDNKNNPLNHENIKYTLAGDEYISYEETSNFDKTSLKNVILELYEMEEIEDRGDIITVDISNLDLEKMKYENKIEVYS